jgi:hypothetical protein
MITCVLLVCAPVAFGQGGTGREVTATPRTSRSSKTVAKKTIRTNVEASKGNTKQSGATLTAHARADRAKAYLVNEHKIDAGRIETIVRDSRAEPMVELWMVSSEAPPPTGSSLKHYGDVDIEEEKAYLDNFARELQYQPATHAYIIVYSGRRKM